MLFSCQGTIFFGILVEKSMVYTSSTGGKVELVIFERYFFEIFLIVSVV